MAAQEVVLVRHGAVDYDCLAAHSPIYDGSRYDFAPLSDEGASQVQQLVPVLRLRPLGLIVSSPYTRTLHTAAILAAGLGCHVTVDLDLHDWLPVKDGRQPLSADLVDAKIAEYECWKASRTLPPDQTWETDDDMRSRLLAAIHRHRSIHGLVVVTHEAVIKSLVSADEVPLASLNVLSI